MGNQFDMPLFQAIDSNGNPLSGGKLYSYRVGTSALKPLYTDREATIVATNPVILDANGQAEIYGIGYSKLILKDADDTEIWTVEKASGSGLSIGDYVLPQWYGAEGDGSTDDTAALQSAIAAAAGGVLLIPKTASFYLISSSADHTKIIEIPDNTTVIIEGEIRQKVADTKTAIILTNNDWTNGNTNIHIFGRGGIIDCNNRNVGSSAFSPAVALRRVTECSVRRLLVRDSAGPGINIERPGGRLIISGNLIDGDPADSGTPTGCDGSITIQDSITPGPSQIVISDNISRYTMEGIGCNAANDVANSGELIITGNSINNVSTGNGITIAGFTNFIISNNFIKTVRNSGIGVRYYDDGLGGAASNMQNGVIDGNFITDAGATAGAGQDAHGIKLGRSTSVDDGYLVVSNNKILNSGNATAGGDGIRLSINTHHISLNGNIIHGSQENGINLAGTSGNEIEFISISGGVISNSQKNGINLLNADFISIGGAIQLINNGLAEIASHTYGARIQDCDTLLINGILATDNQGTKTQTHGLSFHGTNTNISTIGNQLIGNKTAGSRGWDSISSGRWENNNGTDGYEDFTAASGNLSLIFPTRIDSTSNAVDATLGSGEFYGQIKMIMMTEASNSSTVSVTNHETSDPEVFTFAQVDDTLVLMWTGTEWITIANSGVAT